MWINSPGGDCVAAAQIYNMLSSYNGKVTVKIDGIAMAGDTVLMSPVSMLMIHNPATAAFGDHAEMQKAIDMLSEVKESIINAYVIKTGQSRAKLSHLMDAETWMDANKAVELGFADDILTRAEFPTKKEDDPDEEEIQPNKEKPDEEEEKKTSSFLFSRKAVNNALLNKLTAKYGAKLLTVTKKAEIKTPKNDEHSVDEIFSRLDTISKFT